MGRSILRAALAAEKGVDFKKLKEKKRSKQAAKENAKKKKTGGGLLKEVEEEEEEEWGDEEDGKKETNGLIDDEAEESDEDGDYDEDSEEVGADFIAAMDDSDESDSEVEMEAKIVRPKATPRKASKGDDKDKDEDEDEDEEEDEEEDEDVEWSDLDEEARAGLAVRRRETINNTAALMAAWARIRLPGSAEGAAFSTHQTVTSAGPPTAEALADIQDDATRELELCQQSRAAAVVARRQLRAEGVPFTRPNDYFAEMVKDDGHMAQVKAKLVEEATAKKASAEARKQRELKKFGKQVQVAKMQERAKAKREALDKIQSLKRKRQETGATSTHEADLFDVAVDDELSSAPKSAGGKRKGGGGGGGNDRSGAAHAPNAKRQKKNEKFGFGGKKRHAKSGDAISSGDLSGFNMRRKPGSGGPNAHKTLRPGKARRKAAAGRR